MPIPRGENLLRNGALILFENSKLTKPQRKLASAGNDDDDANVIRH
jgi:hypothetical protein